MIQRLRFIVKELKERESQGRGRRVWESMDSKNEFQICMFWEQVIEARASNGISHTEAVPLNTEKPIEEYQKILSKYNNQPSILFFADYLFQNNKFEDGKNTF
jgi:hypothetical protein